MDKIKELLKMQFGSNTVRDYFVAFLFFLGLFFMFYLFRKIVLRRLKKFIDKTENEFDDELIGIFENVSPVFYFVVALYFPLRMLVLNSVVEKFIIGAFLSVVVYQAVKVIQDVVEYALITIASKKGEEKVKAKGAFYGLRLFIGIILWVVAILLILSNLGININSLVASLGIGSIAVALAVQNILKDLFSSFSIYFDKPFEVGDYILIGDKQGNVRHVGLKTTRIRTLQGEELIISNSELTSAQVQNFKRMENRRVVMKIAVVYLTSLEKLKKINKIVKEIIENIENVEYGRSHFKEFGDFSLNFEVVYFVNSSDYAEYMDRQQEINFEILDVFEKEKIEMAYPTQTLYIEKK